MTQTELYSEDMMMLRSTVYTILLNKFGGLRKENGEPKHSMKSIQECCHEWVSKGHVSASGIVKFYQAYYAT
jgi:hypothetical protein